jgi:hypothetical protein
MKSIPIVAVLASSAFRGKEQQPQQMNFAFDRSRADSFSRKTSLRKNSAPYFCFV